MKIHFYLWGGQLQAVDSDLEAIGVKWRPFLHLTHIKKVLHKSKTAFKAR